MAIPQDLLDAMPYHLASDIAHDHGLGLVVSDVIKKLVRGTPVPTTKEDDVVATFDTLMDRHDSYKQVKEQQQIFELPSSTESLPSKLDWTPPDGCAFVHDAGPKLFKLLKLKQYITYGTILDSATKPKEDAIFVPVPRVVPSSVFRDLGFTNIVGPLELQGDLASPSRVKAILSYQPARDIIQYDLPGAKRVRGFADASVKELGKPEGYLASVAMVKQAIDTKNQPDLYIIGKALGDALQVMSVRDSQRDLAVRLIHNTEDRLNFVRCRVFDIPAIHVGRVTKESPVRACTFVPSRAMITDTPADRFKRYLLKLKGFLQVTASNYDRVIKQFTDPQTTLAPQLSPAYCAEAVRQIQLLKIGTLFHFMTWYLYYDAKKAAPTEEDAKELAKSHDTLAASAKRLSPYGSITRINGLDYVQKFVVCHAPPDDCDLGGFPIVPTEGTNLKERATAIVDVLFGRAPIETITTGDARLKIDVAGLQALLTDQDINISTEPLVPPPAEVSIPSGGGAGYGIRGTYYLELVQDAKSQKQAPSRTLVGGAGVKRVREEDTAPPREEKKARVDEPAIGTDDISLFKWYVETHTPTVSPSNILATIQQLARPGQPDELVHQANESVVDFGLLTELTDPDGGIVPSPGGDPARSVAVWNAFLCYVNRGILDRKKSNLWVPLHTDEYEDPLVDELVRLEQSFLATPVAQPPAPVVATPPQPLQLVEPVAAARRPPPPHGISQQDWNEALDELEAHYRS